MHSDSFCFRNKWIQINHIIFTIKVGVLTEMKGNKWTFSAFHLIKRNDFFVLLPSVCKYRKYRVVFTAPSSPHPPIPLLNKPSSSSSSHSPTFYLCCTWEMRGGWEGRWMKQGAENEREGGGEKRARLGKNALWLDLKVCGISFSERGELHLLQIL